MLHYIGTSAALICLVTLVVTRSWVWLPAPLVVGYGTAWISHKLFENNRPLTFTYPLWSLFADLLMYYRFISGHITADLCRAGVRPRPCHVCREAMQQSA